MIYLISGKDYFRSFLHFQKIMAFYKKDNVSFFRVDFMDRFVSPPSLGQIRDFLGTNTLFSSLKLVVLENMFRGMTLSQRKGLWQVFKEKNIAETKDIMVIIYEGDVIKKSLFKTWLERKAKVVKEFVPLRQKQLEKWIREESATLGIELSPSAQTLLIASFPHDSGLIYQALQKLSLSPSRKITREYLENNIFLPFSNTIFDLLDNIAQRKIDQAYVILKKEFIKGTNPLVLLKMIIFEFRNLLKLKMVSAHSLTQIQKAVNLHPYVIRKTYPLAQKFSVVFLKKMYRRLFYYDRKIKQGSIDGQVALELFLLDFSRQKCNTY